MFANFLVCYFVLLKVVSREIKLESGLNFLCDFRYVVVPSSDQVQRLQVCMIAFELETTLEWSSHIVDLTECLMNDASAMSELGKWVSIWFGKVIRKLIVTLFIALSHMLCASCLSSIVIKDSRTCTMQCYIVFLIWKNTK